MSDATWSAHDRLLLAIARATGAAPPLESSLWNVPLAEPMTIQRGIADYVGPDRAVAVTGTLEQRLVLIENSPGGSWTAADLSGQAHASRPWPAWAENKLVIAEPQDWLSRAKVTATARHRLLRPRLLLASLYHPEHFPLPRFPLAISDLARAARLSLLGQVELMDMQLGTTLEDICSRATSGEIDILGISATFGQHDLMTQLLDAVTASANPPLLLAGGSLPVRNQHTLLERYPNLIIGRGAGEPTVADVLAHWHGDLDREQIRGAAYRGAARGEGTLTIGPARRTATVPNRLGTDTWPELDLLPATLAHNGVAQLEFSRGCTNFCSFCPRDHKGQWSGTTPASADWVLAAFGEVFDQHPHTSRVLCLVDEEFIGGGPEAVPRALAAADRLVDNGFAWETSCRIDQVIHLGQDRNWHLERAQMWRDLVARGLRRCLFGVESGVTSILQRFNKETTSDQNALAIRTLTALGVPPRFTYITFDPLMSLRELQQTYAFQGRTDLLLKPQPELSVAEIVDGVRDPAWVATHTTGRPFHSAISYMLVRMECLTGAAYTRQVQAAGLTGAVDPMMGRVEARYRDWRIGTASEWAQRWIDRNFALDYTLKSLEKILHGPAYDSIRNLRRVLRNTAYRVLSGLLDAVAGTDLDTGDRWRLQERCTAVAEATIRELHAMIDPLITTVQASLFPEHRDLLHEQYGRWSATHTWQLINAVDPCGT